MASRKIGAKIALDGQSEYKQAIASIVSETKKLDAQGKAVNATYSAQQNTLEALTAKNEHLTKTLDAQNRKLETIKAGLNAARESQEKFSKKMDEARASLEKETAALEEMKKSGSASADEIKNQQEKVDQLSATIKNSEGNYALAQKRVDSWETELAKATVEVKKTSDELEKNTKYLDEASSSADGCATSIDSMGKEAKQSKADLESLSDAADGTGDSLKDAGNKSSAFKDMLKANLTSEAIISGVKKLGEAAKEAAEYAVEVGSSFEAAMSQVAATSGATSSELEAMEGKAKELGRSTQFSASEVAEAFNYMALAGWETSDMLSGIDGVLNLAAAAQMDLALASDMVTDYLSAFGMEASESAYMANLLASAQANSNTTAEMLGEAYKNCAANMNAAGQDIETTTALLEAMANQGLKGSEAGTALAAIMRDLTSKMKDGKVAIGKTNVEVADARGNYRDLTDILRDVESATEGMGTAEKSAALSATFTSDSIKGLNLVLNEGVGKTEEYERALRSSAGAAEEMSSVVNDNLAGDLKALDSATEGLGIAVYGYIDGPLRSAVQGVTDIVNGITDAITPQETAMEQFTKEAAAANEELERSMESARTVLENAELDAGKVTLLGRQLMELNGVEDKSLAQKYKLREVVGALGESIPEITAAYNAETDSVNLTNAEITALIANTKELMIVQAAQSAGQDIMSSMLEAQVQYDNLAEIVAAQEEQVKAYEDALSELERLQEEYADEYGNVGFDKVDEYAAKVLEVAEAVGISKDEIADYSGVWYDIEISLKNTRGELEKNQEELITLGQNVEASDKQWQDLQRTAAEMTEETKEFNEAMAETPEAVKDSAEAWMDASVSQKSFRNVLADSSKTTEMAVEIYKDRLPSALADTSRAAEGTAQAVQDAADDFSDAEEDIEESTDRLKNAQEEALSSILGLYQDFKEQAGSSLSFDFLGEEFSGGYDNTVENMLENSRKQIEGLENYEKNLEILRDHLGKEITPEFLQYLEGMGTDAANILEHIAITFKQDNGSELVSEWCQNYMDSLDIKDRIADIIAGDSMALADGLHDLGSTDAEWDELTAAMDSAIQTVERSGGEYSNSVKEAFAQAVETAKEVGIQIPDGLLEGIESGEVSVEEASAALNRVVQGQLEGLAQIARDRGVGVSDELLEGIQNGTADPEEAFSWLIEAIASSGAQAGEQAGDEYIAGIGGKEGAAENAGGSLSGAAAEGAKEKESEFSKAGETHAEAYAEGISRNSGGAESAAESMASEAAEAAAGREYDFWAAGYNASGGMAKGLRAGEYLVSSAAKQMAQAALQTAKEVLEIKSPSKKFSKEVGEQIPAGTAKGIESATGTVEDAARTMASKAVKAAKKELTVSGAFSGALKGSISSQIGSGFGISRTTTAGSGDSLETIEKDAGKYYSEVYSAARKYLSNISITHDISLRQQEAYWLDVRKLLEKGSQAWYDATEQIKEIREREAEAATESLEGILSDAQSYVSHMQALGKMNTSQSLAYWQNIQKQVVKEGGKYTETWYAVRDEINAIKESIGTVSSMSALLSKYEMYYGLSEKAEMQYWNTVRKQFAAGTDARIEADEKYLEAKEAYTDRLKELEDDYLDKVLDVDGRLEDSLKDLTESYESTLKNRTESISSAFSMFDEFESSSADGKTLLFNIKSQAAGYEDWMQQLDELEGKGILDNGLMDELKKQGPEISASIHALNSLTEEELAEYNQAYLKKMELSAKQAEEDTAALKKETEEQTAVLVAQAEKDRAELKAEYEKAVAEVNTGITSQLLSLAKSVKSIAEDQTSALVAAIQGVAAAEGMGSSTGSGVRQSTMTAAGVAATSSGGTETAAMPVQATSAGEDKILAIINSGKKLASMTAEQKKNHSDLYNYIYKHYKRKGSSKMFKSLADALGTPADSTPTKEQKAEILNLLKKAGYHKGGRVKDPLIWMDEMLDDKGPEMLVRRSDNAILTRVKPGDEVIDADSAANMIRWGQYDPARVEAAMDAAQKEMELQNAALQKQLEDMSAQASIAKLNNLTSQVLPIQAGSTGKLEGMISQMMEMVSTYLPYLADQKQIVLDSGQLVGGIEGRMSSALAMRSRRKRM